MKTIYIFMFLLPLRFHTNAQIEIHTFGKFKLVKEIEHQIAKDSIVAKQVLFEYPISDFFIDTFHNVIILYFQISDSEGEKTNMDIVSAYSLKDNKLLWEKKVNRNKVKYTLIDTNFYITENNKTSRVDIETLQTYFTIDGKLWADSSLISKGIALGYDFLESDFHDRYACFDFQTGQIHWINKEIDSKLEGLNRGFLKDSFYIFIHEKLNGIHIYNGTYWSYNYDFYSNSLKKINYLNIAIETVVLSAMSNLFMGTTSTLQNSLIMNNVNLNSSLIPYCSNTYQMKDYFYIANDSSLLKFDYRGNLLTKIYYPNRKKTGMSELFSWRDKTFFINLGYTYHMGYMTDDGCAPAFMYLFSQDKDSFSQSVHFSDTNLNIGHYVLGMKKMKNDLVWILNNGFCILDSNLKVRNKKIVDKVESKNWLSYVKTDMFEEVNNQYEFIPKDLSEYYIVNKDLSVNKYDSEFQFRKLIKKYDIFSIIYQDKDIFFIRNEARNLTVVLDNKYHEIFKIKNVVKVELKNNHYVIALSNELYLIDKKELVK